MSSSVVVAVSAESLIARLKGMPEKFRIRVGIAVARLTIKIQARVKDKLSGEVLHVRTGTLRRSINREVQQRSDGIFGVVGTNVEYAAVHEFGFNGAVTVRAHLRRSKAQFALPKKNRVGKDGGEVFVRQHTRMVNLPERSFLRSSLREFQNEIVEDMRTAAREAIQ